MVDIIERRSLGSGYKAVISYDQDCPNPRDWDGSFLWLGFPHRHYTFGDEQIDPNTIHIPCTACGGTGLAGGVMHDNLEHDEACDDCAGYGYTEGTTKLSEIIAWATKEHDALVVRPVSMTDHSGTYFNLGGPQDPWDSGYCGLLLFTKDHVEKWGNDDWTEDDIVKQMESEIEQYETWANGGCYMVDIYDLNGDDVDSCGGFVGDDAVDEYIDAFVKDMPPEPEPLHTVRLTRRQIECLRLALGDGGVTLPDDEVERIDTTLKGAL